MARTRQIKPDFFEDTTLANCCPLARYLYPCIWCHVDGQQLVEADPRIHKKNAFPYDDGISVAQVKEMIDELVGQGRLIRLSHLGKELLYCPRLRIHSRVYDDETRKFNVASDVLTSLEKQTPGFRAEPRGTNAGDAEAEAEAEAKGESEGKNRQARKPALDVESVYRDYPPRDNTGKSRGLALLRAQIKTTEDLEKACKAAQNYARFAKTLRDPRFLKQFKTWCGEWRDWIEWKPSRAPARVENSTPATIAIDFDAVARAAAKFGPDDWEPAFSSLSSDTIQVIDRAGGWAKMSGAPPAEIREALERAMNQLPGSLRGAGGKAGDVQSIIAGAASQHAIGAG